MAPCRTKILNANCPPALSSDVFVRTVILPLQVLGSPSSEELHSMKVDYSSADLPALRPYLWQRLFPSDVAPEALALISRLLTFDPTKRITASETMHHSLFGDASVRAESLAQTQAAHLSLTLSITAPFASPCFSPPVLFSPFRFPPLSLPARAP